jgi:hypothetical protein
LLGIVLSESHNVIDYDLQLFHHLTQETLEMLLSTVREFYIRHVLTHEEYMRRTQDGSL